jgi:uncharacterized protein
MPFPFHLDHVVDQPNVASLFYGPVLLAAEESGPWTDWRRVTFGAQDMGTSRPRGRTPSTCTSR